MKLKQRLAALSLAITMGAISLTGCSDYFNYEKQDSGIVVVTGKIKYDSLKNVKLVHITNEIAELDKYYLVYKDVSHERRQGDLYTNYIGIETGKTVYREPNSERFEVVCSDFENFNMDIILDGVVDYLYKYDMFFDEYSIDDVIAFKEYLLNDDTLFPTMQSNSNLILERKL